VQRSKKAPAGWFFISNAPFSLVRVKPSSELSFAESSITVPPANGVAAVSTTVPRRV
jgi:hypothetical protein